MIKPNRKSKKRYQFHPIQTSKQDLSSALSQQQPSNQPTSILAKLNSSSSKIREQITSLLANATVFPNEMTDKQILKQLLIRIVDDIIPIAYNAVFAVNNLIRIDQRYLQLFYDLNVLQVIVSMLKRIPSIQNPKITKRVIQGVYLLIQTILTTLSLQQLRYLQTTQNMKFICTFAIDALANLQYLHNSEIIFQVLAYLSEYSLLRVYIGESVVLEKLFEGASDAGIKGLLCTILIFSKGNLDEKLIGEISDFVNETIDDINLQAQYNLNISKQSNEEAKQQEINMQVQMAQNNDDFVDIEQDKVLQTQQPNSPKPIISQAFLDSITLLQITSNLILSLVQQPQQQDIQDDDSLGQQQPMILNHDIRNQLKQKLRCVNGIIRNAGLMFFETEVLVEQSWSIIRNSLSAFNSENLLELCLVTLNNLVENKLPFTPQLLLSIMENCLEIVFKIWKSHPNYIKYPFPVLLHLTTYSVLQKATNKIVVLIFDLLSLKYNPEQQLVTQAQNQTIGTNLRQFMIKSTNVELQCQCLDTIFSVYSNENFDGIFKGLGYLELLEQGLAALIAYKHRIKFTRVVQQDLIRFLDYKRGKMVEQKLI